MDAPADLGEAGLRAFDTAVLQVSTFAVPEKYTEAVLRFARAVDAVDRTRADWIDRGRPLIAEHSNGAIYTHPLVKQIQDAEREAARAGRALYLEPASAEKAPKRVAEWMPGGTKAQQTQPPTKTSTGKSAERVYLSCLGRDDLEAKTAEAALKWAEKELRPPLLTFSDPDAHYAPMLERYLDGAELAEDDLHGLRLWYLERTVTAVA